MITECMEQRANRTGAVLWLTGLSGSGKTTLANALNLKLSAIEVPFQSYVLDGDDLRSGPHADLGFSYADRAEHVRRTGRIASLLAERAYIAIAALISPFRKDRDQVRNALPTGRFVEIYLECSLAVCEKRDVKGLYQKARNGLIKDFTGISSPYIPPLNPEIRLRTDMWTVEECVQQVIGHLESAGILPNLKDLSRCG